MCECACARVVRGCVSWHCVYLLAVCIYVCIFICLYVSMIMCLYDYIIFVCLYAYVLHVVMLCVPLCFLTLCCFLFITLLINSFSNVPEYDESVEPPSGVVTWVFTDVQDSTPLWEVSPKHMSEALSIQNTIMRTAIKEHRAYPSPSLSPPSVLFIVVVGGGGCVVVAFVVVIVAIVVIVVVFVIVIIVMRV